MKMNELYAQHYEAIGEHLSEQSLLLDKDKYAELVDTMMEASRCLAESAARLYEK